MSVPEPGCYVAQAMEGIAESTASSKEGDFHGGASNEGINNEVPNTNAKDVREEVIEAIDDAINFMEAKDAEEPAPTSHAVNAMQAPNNTGIKANTEIKTSGHALDATHPSKRTRPAAVKAPKGKTSIKTTPKSKPKNKGTPRMRVT